MNLAGGEERGSIRFLFEGRLLTAREGETIAAALTRHGVRIFGRSSKYHRPRGYRCGRGDCGACAMRVDGLPGVRTCVTKVRSGMVVEREHAWPNADRDVLRVAELFSPLMPPGFYYRWFRRSPRLWHLFERFLAHLAGQGGMPSRQAAERLLSARCVRRTVDVLVVGGGIAGMTAACAAAETGASVLLVERDDELGGRLRDRAGRDSVEDFISAVVNHPSVEVLTEAEVLGWYEEGTLAVHISPDLLLVNPSQVVLATGGYDRGLPFPNWDISGVAFTSGILRLLSRYSVCLGMRAAIVTDSDVGYEDALRLLAAGIDLACVADTRVPDAVRSPLAGGVEARGVPVLTNVKSLRAEGFNGVSGLAVLHGGTRSTFECDLVCVSSGCLPADELAFQALARGSFVLSASGSPERRGDASPGVHLAGLLAGALTVTSAVRQAEQVGRLAASAVSA